MFSPFLFLLIFLLTVPALIFSILSWRLKNDVMFWLGVVFTGFLLIYYLYHFQFVLVLLFHIETFLYGIFILATVGFPVYFLISSKRKSSPYRDSDTTDGSDGRNSNEVTPEYLDSIINSEDEELDFEK